MKRRAVGLPDIPGILAHYVEPGSWAEDTGFRKGDLIYAVWGERAIDCRVAQDSQQKQTARKAVLGDEGIGADRNLHLEIILMERIEC